MLLEIVAAPRAASATLRVISPVVALCSSTAVAITVEIWLILSITPLDPPDRLDRPARVLPDHRDLLLDLFRRLGRLLGQFLDFVGHHREALPRLARPRR